MKTRAPRPDSAFSLVEVTLAIGIVAFGAIILYGLLPAGIAVVREGTLEESATDIVSAAAADLRWVTSAQAVSPIYELPALAAAPVASTRFLDEDGMPVSGQNGATFRLDFTPCPNPNPRLAVWHVAVLWPAGAAEPANSAESLVVLNRP